MRHVILTILLLIPSQAMASCNLPYTCWCYQEKCAFSSIYFKRDAKSSQYEKLSAWIVEKNIKWYQIKDVKDFGLMVLYKTGCDCLERKCFHGLQECEPEEACIPPTGWDTVK